MCVLACSSAESKHQVYCDVQMQRGQLTMSETHFYQQVFRVQRLGLLCEIVLNCGKGQKWSEYAGPDLDSNVQPSQDFVRFLLDFACLGVLTGM